MSNKGHQKPLQKKKKKVNDEIPNWRRFYLAWRNSCNLKFHLKTFSHKVFKITFTVTHSYMDGLSSRMKLSLLCVVYFVHHLGTSHSKISCYTLITLLIAILYRIPCMGKASCLKGLIPLWVKHTVGIPSFHK